MRRTFAAAAGTTAYPSIDDLFADACPDVVHICTPPAAHFEAARAVLERGAHVYVEKPFALTTRDAARAPRPRRVEGARSSVPAINCCTTRRSRRSWRVRATLGSIVQIDSHFAFRPHGILGERASARLLGEQAIDVLPHPLYTLVAALERFKPVDEPIALAWTHADPADLHAILSAGPVVGRLSISLRARPVASTLTLVGTGGSLTCDFVRSIVVGAGNPGTEALEKISNPVIEAGQLVARTAASLYRRLRRGAYPGLAELIEAFYRAVSNGTALAGDTRASHARDGAVRSARRAHSRSSGRDRSPPPRAVPRFDAGRPGRRHGRARLSRQRHRARAGPVKGISRTPDADNPNVREWIAADLSSGLPPGSLAGTDVVVHAAAETAGGYDAHQRNSIDATRTSPARDARRRRLEARAREQPVGDQAAAHAVGAAG